MARTRCPHCKTVIKMEKPREGAFVLCPGCGMELEVIRTDPFQVALVLEYEVWPMKETGDPYPRSGEHIGKTGGTWKWPRQPVPSVTRQSFIEKPIYGAEITCHACGEELEIISTDPFEVDYPLDYDKDWEDDSEEN